MEDQNWWRFFCSGTMVSMPKAGHVVSPGLCNMTGTVLSEFKELYRLLAWEDCILAQVRSSDIWALQTFSGTGNSGICVMVPTHAYYKLILLHESWRLKKNYK